MNQNECNRDVIIQQLQQRITELENDKKEMLKFLIESIKHDIDERGCNGPMCHHCSSSDCYTRNRFKIIEKVTGKKIEEII